MNQIMSNYHTHTTRCKHAYGSDEQFVLSAIKAGYTSLAFTDHSPWLLYPFEAGSIRMHISEMEEYVESINHLKRQYRDEISIYVGLEAEYYRDRIDWLINLKQKHQLDLLILGNHFRGHESNETYYGNYRDKTNVYKHYVEDAIDAMATEAYSIFAHPDLYFRTNNKVDKVALEAAQQICDAANHYNVALEYNLGGIRYGDNSYPKDEFWQVVAKNKNVSVIGVDAHRPKHLEDIELRKKAQRFLNDIGVVVVEEIKLK